MTPLKYVWYFLGRYLPADLGLYLKFSKHIITGGGGSYEGFAASMVYMIVYDHKLLDITYHVNLEE